MANQRTYIRCISLLGKLNANFHILDNPDDMPIDLTPEELDLMRMAAIEYNFYHVHERVEAGTDEAYNLAKKQAASEVGKRQILSRKTTT